MGHDLLFVFSHTVGALLAIARRRTTTKWLQAAAISDHFRLIFYHKPSIRRKSPELFDNPMQFSPPRTHLA